MAYDLLEADGRDIRDEPLDVRRASAECLAAGAALADGAPLTLSPLVEGASWEALAERASAVARRAASRASCSSAATSPYGTGRRKGDWWKWKVDPYSVDAVLVYAQAGNGRRASLFTDYTFAVWEGGELVPVAKAYSGLSNEEIEAARPLGAGQHAREVRARCGA